MVVHLVHSDTRRSEPEPDMRQGGEAVPARFCPPPSDASTHAIPVDRFRSVDSLDRDAVDNRCGPAHPYLSLIHI